MSTDSYEEGYDDGCSDGYSDGYEAAKKELKEWCENEAFKLRTTKLNKTPKSAAIILRELIDKFCKDEL